MSTVIIEYGAGNVQSVIFALKRLGIEAQVTADLEKISSAERVIFPGVGEASSAMEVLRTNGLSVLIPQLKQPVLGICLGLQLLCTHSEEQNTECLGVFSEKVRRFNGKLKIPQIGWNTVALMEGRLTKDLSDNSYLYFVHSYYAELGPNTKGLTEYQQKFSAILEKDNFYATQFHPEKSGAEGQKILENFLSIR